MERLLLALALTLISFTAKSDDLSSSDLTYVGVAFKWSGNTLNYAFRSDSSYYKVRSRLNSAFGTSATIVISDNPGGHCALARQASYVPGQDITASGSCAPTLGMAEDDALKHCDEVASLTGQYCQLIGTISGD